VSASTPSRSASTRPPGTGRCARRTAGSTWTCAGCSPRDTVGAEHSVFGITVFPPGAKHDIHRHPNAEEWEYLVSGHGIARVGDADVELGPGEVVFVPKNDYHGFENTGDEPVCMLWGYAGAASLDEAGYIREVDERHG